jgi:DNA-binding transcriptional LysR family regulator
VAVKGWLIASNPHRETYSDALLAGLGVARTADWGHLEDVRKGTLVRLLADWESTEAPPLCVSHPPGATRLPRVRAVIEFATAMMVQVSERRGLDVSASPPPAWLRGAHKRASAWPRR